jgi:hypothetical protein
MLIYALKYILKFEVVPEFIICNMIILILPFEAILYF